MHSDGVVNYRAYGPELQTGVVTSANRELPMMVISIHSIHPIQLQTMPFVSWFHSGAKASLHCCNVGGISAASASRVCH